MLTAGSDGWIWIIIIGVAIVFSWVKGLIEAASKKGTEEETEKRAQVRRYLRESLQDARRGAEGQEEIPVLEGARVKPTLEVAPPMTVEERHLDPSLQELHSGIEGREVESRLGAKKGKKAEPGGEKTEFRLPGRTPLAQALIGLEIFGPPRATRAYRGSDQGFLEP